MKKNSVQLLAEGSARKIVFFSLFERFGILFLGFPRNAVGRRRYSAAEMQNESEIGFLVVMLLSTRRSFYIWLISGDVLKVYNPFRNFDPFFGG